MLALPGVVAALLIALLTSSIAQAAERRALLVTEARGFIHPSIPTAETFFIGLGERSNRFDVIPLRGGAAQLTSGRLRRADAVIFANTSGELPVPDRQTLKRFVRRGGAFIGTHSASDTFHSWPAFESLLGGEFLRHGAVQEGRLIIEQRNDITRGLPRSFRLTDEFYEFASPVPTRKRVLVRLDPASVPDEMGTDIPLIWTRRYGSGRVFYDALGHEPQTWHDAVNARILARGVAWALAGQR